MPAFCGTIFVDSASTLYTLDPTNGTLTTVATGFTNARGITQGSDGKIYVADLGANEVYQINNGVANPWASINGAYGLVASGSNILVSTFNGSGNIYTTDGTDADNAVFLATGGGNLTDLTYNGQNLYISSQGNHGVLQYDGTNTTLYADLSGDSFNPATGSSAATPRGLAFDSDGNLYVTDSAAVNGGGSGVYSFDSTGANQTTLATAGAAKGLVLDNGTLYFADSLAQTPGVYGISTLPESSTSLVSALSGVQELYETTASVNTGTPEPGTITMMLGGLSLGLLGLRRRRA